MSKQNKVNPGRYTQRGRLTQDDAARAFAQQRTLTSSYTAQPTKKNAVFEPASPVAEAPDEVKSAEAPQPTKTARPTARKTSTARTKAPMVKTTPPAASAKPRPARRAALARSAGGPGLKPLEAAKRPKSRSHAGPARP